MKNRPKPGARSYSANGGEVRRFNREELPLTEAEVAKAEAALAKAVAETAELKQRIKVLETEAKGQAELIKPKQCLEDGWTK